MTRRDDARRKVLNWYPPSWREKYGHDLLDLLSDTYGDRRIPWGARWSLVRGGVGERCRDAALFGRTSPPGERVRSGALVVLVAWSLFVVGGSGFAKYSEYWDAVTPLRARAQPSAAFATLQLSAFVGGALVAAGAAMSAASLFSYSRRVGWRAVERLLTPLAVVTVVTLFATLEIVMLAHHLDTFHRSVGFWPYRFAWLVWVAIMVSEVVVVTSTLWVLARRLQYSMRVLRTLRILALLMVGSIVTMFASFVVWWVDVARSAPWFFGSGKVGGSGSTAPLPMVAFGVMMFAGVLTALYGTARLSRATGGEIA